MQVVDQKVEIGEIIILTLEHLMCHPQKGYITPLKNHYNINY